MMVNFCQLGNAKEALGTLQSVAVLTTSSRLARHSIELRSPSFAQIWDFHGVFLILVYPEGGHHAATTKTWRSG